MQTGFPAKNLGNFTATFYENGVKMNTRLMQGAGTRQEAEQLASDFLEFTRYDSYEINEIR